MAEWQGRLLQKSFLLGMHIEILLRFIFGLTLPKKKISISDYGENAHKP